MLLVRAVVLVAASALAGLGINAMRPGGLRVSSFEAPAVCEGAEAAGQPLEVDPAEAAASCGSSDVVIADARPANRFAEGHVAGAIHLPCDAAGSVAAEALHRLEGKKTVIVYGEETADAQPVAASLRRRTHGVRIVTLRGGFKAWSEGGQACASGPCDTCKDHP
jgi:rhodanese-related sulfurtransferase